MAAVSSWSMERICSGLLPRETAAIDHFAVFGHCASFGNVGIIGLRLGGVQQEGLGSSGGLGHGFCVGVKKKAASASLAYDVAT